MRRIFFGILALISAAFAAPASADPVKIRVAWMQPVSNISSILFAKKGIARRFGQSYIMEPVHFDGTPLMVTGLAVGEIDVGVLGAASLGLGVLNANMDDLRIVADEFQDGAAKGYSNEFMVRDDGTINTVEDLKGKVIGTSSIGGAVDTAMRAMLRKHGLEDKRDYTVVEVPGSAKKAALLSKKVDLVSLPLPFSYDPELRAKGRTLFTQKDIMGVSSMGFWAAREGFLKKNHDAFVDFMEDTLRLTRWYIDPKNHDEAVAIAASFSKTKPDFFADWLFTDRDYYRDPDLKPNLDALQSNIDVTADLGFLPRKFDVKKLADTEYLDEAAKRAR